MIFYIWKDKDGEWRFRIISHGNHKTLASSEGYTNLVDCEAAVKIIKENAAGAYIGGDDEYKKLRP